MRGRWHRWHVKWSVAGLSLTVLFACTRPSSSEPQLSEAPLSAGEMSVSRAPRDLPEPFELHGTPRLLLSPEGYYATSVAVAADGTFVLTPGSLGPEGGRTLHLGRYTLKGQLLWERTLTGNVEGPRLATSGDGDITLWVYLGYGGDFGAGPVPNIDYGLVRFAADGRFLWARGAACDGADPQVDARGEVTVMQQAGCQSDGPTEFIQRFTASGETSFGVLVWDGLHLSGARHVTSPNGQTLVGGRDVERDLPTWSQLGTDGLRLSSGSVRDVSGYFSPLQLTEDGQYLALLQGIRGLGSFAGQELSCTRDAQGRCLPYLLSGDVNGREDSAVVLSNDERVLWVSPSRELVTLATDAAGTGSILRRRSSNARLLATYALPSLSPVRPQGPNVQVAQVVPLPDGTLLVLGTLVGKAELGGELVEADWSRLFLLRVAL
jgi:hypothetical protein